MFTYIDRTYIRFRLQYIDRTYVRSDTRTYIEHMFDLDFIHRSNICSIHRGLDFTFSYSSYCTNNNIVLYNSQKWLIYAVLDLLSLKNI